ncbi:CBL-interacting protein kinase 1-like isoform X2 [Telopea speciosissima]|uniref:CBL-interacting protein kinase 1-like isoform X2 n=1 Tax=Telopea speciosissima TaxID=54955 RepID=UPI001CC3E3FF|nr:CBL-interacting protein kinase 1-like isoform X2 [Telopea speciosissima]
MVGEVEKKRVMRLGKYELGRTLGEGNFAKVKYAIHLDSGHEFAVKILNKKKILDLKISNQIKREIGTLKLLKHPNVVRLHEVLASKTKIYMVLEYVNGGELFDRIASKGRLTEAEGRRLFQQLIDGVSYCHDKGVFHRDLKDDGLLHTTCGSPNYVAPEVLANRGYDGAMSDLWSCGVILYVILIGYLPFDDRNLAVLYQKIFKGDVQIPKWLSPSAKNLIKKMLDPNPQTRISMAEIKANDWFNRDYVPANPYDEEEDIFIDAEAFSMQGVTADKEEDPGLPTLINAFQLIGMSSCLDLSGFFEKEEASERKIMFTSNYSSKDLLEKIEDIVTEMGFLVQKRKGKLKVMQENKGHKRPGSLSVAAEVFKISKSLYVVELRKAYGDPMSYRQLCSKLSNELGVRQEILATQV